MEGFGFGWGRSGTLCGQCELYSHAAINTKLRPTWPPDGVLLERNKWVQAQRRRQGEAQERRRGMEGFGFGWGRSGTLCG